MKNKPKKPIKKDVEKLRNRNSLDFLYSEAPSTDVNNLGIRANDTDNNGEENFALKRLKALEESKENMDSDSSRLGLSPVNPGMTNWLPLGPLAIPNGQTYGGARVLVSGRVTSVVNHPTNSNIIYLGTSRGGVWKTTDGGTTWIPKSDNEASLAIGCLAISKSNPQVLYAGTGEGNVQLYSTSFPLDSAPGIYLGVGILKSIDGGNNWVLQATPLFANHSFYRIAVHNTNANNAFAASSKGLCRTTNGSTWTNITGGGLPAISSSVIACTDVLIDESDTTGNTVYAAFWGSGIYKSTNALAVSPNWTLTTGLPASLSRISIAQSPSSPSIKYALIANGSDSFGGVYKTSNAAGTTWASAFTTGVNLYGAFTSNIAVDPTTPNTIYISGVELYKGVFGATWTVTNIGSNIHPDSHAFSFDPNNSQIIYSGNDGGVYKSSNGGTTWSDTINQGLSLMQYEAIDTHPTSDAIILGGTQDNGTQQYRNSPVFYHAADGDGGYCGISKITPNNVVHSYFGNNFERSTLGGKFTSWANISGGINGNGLFYPPFAMSPTSNRSAIGTNVINIDDAQGTNAWPGSGVALPGISGRVSAIHFASDTVIYAATTSGQVYRLDLVAGTWNVRNLTAAPLASGWIWDIHSFPGNINKIMVVFGNFGIPNHVFTGTVPAAGAAIWTATSAGLSDIPMYALAFESASIVYVGTDIGVFRSVNGGTNWTNYNQGMPNTAIYDLRYFSPLSLLIAGTHGRGLYEIKTNLAATPPSDLYVRDHAMHTGRANSTASVVAGYENLTQHVNLNDNLYWWQCADIKVDAPTSAGGGYQMPVSDVDYIKFETVLTHRNPDKGNVNRVYVQVHNRGTNPATNVTVKILYAGASAGLPNLQADFWTNFPANPSAGAWTAIGVAKVIPVVEPLKPVILEWDWTPPAGADTHSCMLVVIDSASDPIPAANKVFNIGQLVTTEKRVGLKNLHLVNVVPGVIMGLPFHYFSDKQLKGKIRIDLDSFSKYNVGFTFRKEVSKRILNDKSFEGFEIKKITERNIEDLKDRFLNKEFEDTGIINKSFEDFDFENVFFMNKRKMQIITEFNEKGLDTLLVVSTSATDRLAKGKFSIIQEDDKGNIIGGSTFILNPIKK